MNQDFALELTPAIARRLVTIAKLGRVILDERIIATAKEGLLSEDVWADELLLPSANQRAMTQFIIDCGLRCAIACPGIEESVILNAVRLTDFDGPISIATRCISRWNAALQGFTLSDRAKVVTIAAAYDPERNDSICDQEHRKGLLIIDWRGSGRSFRMGDQLARYDNLVGMCREFPRTIVFAPNAHVTGSVAAIASALYDGVMPTSVFGLSLQDIVGHFELPNLTSVDQLAVFYNVFINSELA